MKGWVLLFAAGIAAAMLGAGAYMGLRPAPPVDEPLPPGLAFTGLDGRRHRLDEWHGKLLLVNFWATWCGPCMEEIPELVKLQSKYGGQGLQIVGPAVDDPDSVKAAIHSLGINYPVMTGEVDAQTELMEKLGNAPGALPFSVVISPAGRIVERHLGEFTAADLQAVVQPRLHH